MADEYLQELTEETTWAIDRRVALSDSSTGRLKYADQMFFLRPAMCRVYLTSDLAVGLEDATPFDWDAESFDFGGWWDSGDPERLSVPTGVSYAQAFLLFRTVQESSVDFAPTIMLNGTNKVQHVGNTQDWGGGGYQTTGVIAVTGGTDYFSAKCEASSAFDVDADYAFFSVIGWA